MANGQLTYNSDPNRDRGDGVTQTNANALATVGPVDVGPARGFDAARGRQFADSTTGRAAYAPDAGNVNTAMDLTRAAAMGQAPSRAQILAQNTLDQGFQQQLGAAAGARGGGIAQAAAQRQALQNQAAYNQQGAAQIGAMRAQEMAEARNSLASQATNWAGLQSQNENTQRALNQAGWLGAEGLSQQANQAQANADLGVAGMNSQNWQAWQGNQQENWRHQTDVNQHSADRDVGLIGGIVGGLAGGGASVLGSIFGKAKGGPVAAKTPYLVGEEGPELIVPKDDGVVLPAHVTAALLAPKRAEGGPVEGGGAKQNIAMAARAFGDGMKMSKTVGAMATPPPISPHPVYVRALAHGGPVYAGGDPPSLACAQARAMGGPVEAGMPYVVGEQSPELVVPGSTGLAGVLARRNTAPIGTGGGTVDLDGAGMTGAQVRKASTGLASVPIRGMVGGGGITGGNVGSLNVPGGGWR